MAGILIIAHAPFASALRDCATHVYCGCPQRVVALDVIADAEPAEVLKQARAMLAEVMSENGVLVLTDIFGATPANIAAKLADGNRVRVLAGANVPMLMRAISYRKGSLEELTHKALSGGAQGVLQIGSTTVQNQTFSPDRHAADGYHHQQ